MNPAKIYYCRECKFSHHRSIKNLKNAFLEKEENAGIILSSPGSDRSILEEYAFKNTIRQPEHLGNLSRMAIDTRSDWSPGRRLTVSFMGGQKEINERIMRHASRWMNFANIEFDFKSKKKAADIRISFDETDGSWSAIGTDCLTVDSNAATMNFGWLTPTLNDEEFAQVVLHEFGHALGCIHEHERPDNGIPWDKPKVYAYYKKNDGWRREEVNEQVFDKYDENILRANKLDKKSIMMYSVPEQLTIGNYSIPWNSRLSENDKKFIAKIYPK